MGQFPKAQYLLIEDRPTQPQTLRVREVFPEARGLPEILTRLPLLVLAWDGQGRLVAWNQEAERVSGFRAQEVLGLEPARLPAGLTELGHKVRAGWQQVGGPEAWAQELPAKGGQTQLILWSLPATRLRVPGWCCWVLGLPANLETGAPAGESPGAKTGRKVPIGA